MTQRISTRNLGLLPDIDRLKQVCQSIAMLDAIIKPTWVSRTYAFNSKWAKDDMMASMQDQQGGSYYILFTPKGAIIKGYDHEAIMAETVVKQERVWPGVLDSVPLDFAGFLAEPAFMIEDTTFCIWRRYSDTKWQIGNIEFPDRADPDGSEELLFILDGNPLTYKKWGDRSYNRNIPLDIITQIYDHKHLNPDMVEALNPAITLASLEADIIEIDYPNGQWVDS